MQCNTLIIYKESAIKMKFFLILYIEYKADVKSLLTEDVYGLLKLFQFPSSHSCHRFEEKKLRYTSLSDSRLRYL